jgi:hypothetical protein
MKGFLPGIITILLVSPIFAQRNTCSIGTTRFACPSNFEALATTDKSIRIFKSTESDGDLYFFVSEPTGAFDAAKVGEALRARYSNLSTDGFRWKPVPDPFVMSTRTKYKYDVMASLGLSGPVLVEVKGFVFDIKGKKLVLGYVSDLSENERLNQRLFDKAQGIGDNAVGCNVVVTTLNSITKEFKEAKQYCYLTTLAAPK